MTPLTKHCTPLLAALALLAGCGGSSTGNSGTGNPALTYVVSVSSSSLTFPSTTVGTPAAPQSLTLSNSGTGSIVVSNVAVSGLTGSSSGVISNCGSLAPSATCTVTVTFTPSAAGTVTGTLTITDNATNSPQTVALTGSGVSSLTYVSIILVPSSPFVNVTVGLSSTQTISYTNVGTGTIVFSGVALGGANPNLFSLSTNCTGSLAPHAGCIASVTFNPLSSGPASTTVVFSDNLPTSPETVALTGSAIATASPANTQDCSVATGFCPALNLLGDPLSGGGFHGYADPTMRKDPNSSAIYLAYSWAKTLSDGTHVVDLHLASSTNNGTSFTEAGPLYQSTQSTQTTSTAYNGVNDSSTETIDLLPIPLTGASAGQTLWVQAHQSYLVKPQAGIYDQLNATNVISVSAVQLTAAQEASPAAAATALLGLSTAPEARLGAVSTDPNRNITHPLAALSTSTAKCGNWGQPALWYQSGTLYLALECSEITGGGNIDSNELAHFLYSTIPTGTDASAWAWSYAGEFATAAQAAKLGALASENVPYQFFTEPEFALTRSGQLVVILTPSVFAPQSSQQPVIQYGCRVVPITLTPTSVTLDTDSTTQAPVVLSKVTETDLYTSPNEGPAACTYEPAANTGIVIGRKYENDPMYGFYIYPVSTGIFP